MCNSNPLKDNVRSKESDKVDTKFDVDEDTFIQEVANKAKLRLRILFNKRKNVEITLQHMFEEELKMDDSSDVVDLDNQENIQQRISFYSV